MAKYEIVLIVNGSLTEEQANAKADELAALIKSEPEFMVKNWGLKDLAYQIKGQKTGYYYIYNFSTTDNKTIDEFRRLSLIDTSILRHFIKNVEKDYGYRASINTKKVAWSSKQQKSYAHKQAILKTKKAVLHKEMASEITNNELDELSSGVKIDE